MEHMPATKRFLNVRMASSAALRRWDLGGTGRKLIFSVVMAAWSEADASLSIF